MFMHNVLYMLGLKVKGYMLFDHFSFKEFQDQRNHLDILHIAPLDREILYQTSTF